VLIFKKKFTRTWFRTSICTPENGDGFRADRIRISITFARKGQSLRLSPRADDYAPGEIVTWDLGGNVPHVGLVVDQRSTQSGRYMVVHNIGQGPRMEDVLFNWKITGHYQYFGPGL